jgi:hypothetical protein
LLAQIHARDLAYHFHGDHLLALLLKYSAEQLNTLVNFESALLGLDGQFSVGVNTYPTCIEKYFLPYFGDKVLQELTHSDVRGLNFCGTGK